MEYFFRKQYCIVLMMIFLMIAVLKSDSTKMVGIVHQAAQGFGIVGEHMREETTRVPVTFNIAGRIPTYSGK